MKQGTISIFIGCHSVIHSILVFISWKIIYKKFPSFLETVCIFLHDLGHFNLNYLDSVEQKRKHWKLGAEIALYLFGEKGFKLCAGHDNYSGYKKSLLYKPDKYSWYIAPKWWLKFNIIFEPKIKMGYTAQEAVDNFKTQVKKSILSGEFRSSHDMYLERCKPKQK